MFLIALLIGLLMLVGGAELIVRGGGKLALVLRVPALVVGLTIVAFGTSAPELAVSVTAALRASTEIALANVTGSNIANIALVLGLAALVAPMHVERGLMRREVPVCIGLQTIVPLLCLDGTLSRFDGVLLLLLGIGYNTWLVWDARTMRASVDIDELPELDEDDNDWRRHAAVLVAGLAVLLLGAQLFVTGAVQIAHMMNLSDRFIGLTVVALGTSAPEVATGVVASYRQQADLATGNALGSNILNITMVLAATAMLHPIVIEDRLALVDMAVALGVTAILIPLVLRDRVVSRFEGGAMALGYVGYLFLLT